MSGFFQQVFRGAVEGFLGGDAAFLRDYKHAEKIFLTNGEANSPKYKWLFHVYFEINRRAIPRVDDILPAFINHGILVKSIDLPKYSVALQEMNQYNRKRFIQTKINYDPIKIVFHDDNGNQIRHLWFAYYNYYYNDPSQPSAESFGTSRADPDNAIAKLNPRNIYDPDISGQTDWGYSGENYAGSIDGDYSNNLVKPPFFKSIKIYGLTQHNFALYELINPIIENFTHDNYNYYNTKDVMENQMTIKYETIKYYEGALNGQNPGLVVKGFGNEATYDKTPSPLLLPGNNRTIMGRGGLVDAGLGILDDLARGDVRGVIGAIQTGRRITRTFNSGAQVAQAARTEAMEAIAGAVARPGISRSQFNIPAAGATGSNTQNISATNSRGLTSPPPG